jgi:hypothetical protein
MREVTNLEWLAAVVVLVVLAFGWPTLYRYDHALPQALLVRTNRITGTSSIFDGYGWSQPRGQKPQRTATSDVAERILARWETEAAQTRTPTPTFVWHRDKNGIISIDEPPKQVTP